MVAWPLPRSGSAVGGGYGSRDRPWGTLAGCVAKTSGGYKNPRLDRTYPVTPKVRLMNFICATTSPFATHLTLPFLIMCITSKPCSVRQAVGNEKKPMPTRILRLIKRWSSCRLLPGSCCLPRFQGGSASTTSLSRPCSSFTRVTACRVARPPYSGLCHEASTRSVTRPGRSLATMFTDNYMGGSFPHCQTAPVRRTRKFWLEGVRRDRRASSDGC